MMRMRMPPRHLLPSKVTGLVLLLALCSLPAHVHSQAAIIQPGEPATPQDLVDKDAIFSIKGIEFPSSSANGCLFHFGGATSGMWAGIQGGEFLVTVNSGGNSATVTAADLPTAGTHDLVISVTVGDENTPGQLKVYLDCDETGVATADGAFGTWAGGNEGSYLDAPTSGVPAETNTDAWPVAIANAPQLMIYNDVALFPLDLTEFECTGICNRTQQAGCDENSKCSIVDDEVVCTCIFPYEASGETCVLKYGTSPPSGKIKESSSIADLGMSIYEGDVAIVMEKIKFPTTTATTEQGCLFHFGGRTDGTWAGMLNGKFHVQAGSSGTAVEEGVKYVNTAYVTISDYPTDGAEHTVVVYISIGNAMSPGQVRVYIDCVEKGVGFTDGGTLLGTTTERWTGGNAGSYLAAAVTSVPTGTVDDAWPSVTGSESPLLLYSEEAEPALFEYWTPFSFGCSGFCTAAQASECHEMAACTVEDGTHTCTCPPMPWSGDGEECTLFGPPGETRTIEPGGDLPPLEEDQVSTDTVFLLGGIKFPIIGNSGDITDQDGCLFHTGGQLDGLWAGINNGKFYVQAGASGTAVNTDESYPNTAYLVIDDFPQDGEEHVVLIRVQIGFSHPTDPLLNIPGKISVWIDCIAQGVGTTEGLALGTSGRFSGFNGISYLEEPGNTVAKGVSTAGWQGARGTEWPLRMFSNYTAFSAVDFGCTGECSFIWGSQCDTNAACIRSDASYECSCNTGWEGNGSTCTDIKECNMEDTTEDCHVSAFCQEMPGSYTCLCQPGYVGDGYTCRDQSWGIRTVFALDSLARRALDPAAIEVLKLTYGKLVLFDPLLPPNASVVTGMPFSFGALNFGESVFEIVESESGGQMTFFALFYEKSAADAHAADLANVSASYWDPIGTVVDGPKVYRWEAQTTSNALQVNPTGLTVDFVYFDPTCLASGCWKVEVTYTVGIDNFNVFFLPRASASDQLSYDFDYSTVEYSDWDGNTVASTFFPTNHPCHSHDASDAVLTAAVSSCCLPQFMDMYRPVTNFIEAVAEVDGLTANLKDACGTGARKRTVNGTDVPIFATKDQDVDMAKNIFPRPTAPENPELRTGVFIDSPFAGMTSYINHTGVVDAYIGIYTAILCLDEVELRTLAGQLKGTVGVEHTVDTFIGLAEFSPTGVPFLDPNAVQTNIHLEKTSFFSVSTHGVNDYTFLEYVNLRLVAIYDEDADFSGVNESTLETVRTSTEKAAHYIQVTFTMGSKYDVNDNAGLIPLDSVRAGKGTFFEDDDLEHKCVQYTDGSFPEVASFNGSLLQDCAPAAAMCVSPASVPDQFVAFNIPLGVDWFDPPSNALDNNVFVHMVINAIDTVARGDEGQTPTNPNGGQAPWQMKTTLSASIPVVAGGINIFCDGITAKTDLKDVANADIVVGSANSPAELTRLRILEDVASTQLATAGPQEINTDSIESGLMTLVLKGNSSHFELDGNVAVSIELEDLITIHVMEDDGSGADNAVSAEVLRMLRTAADDNSDSSGIITDGYALNEAFFFTIDRSAQRAHLQPSPALAQLCPWNPTRPAAGVSPLITCVTRRDVQFRNFPWRTGGVSTAMEICKASGGPNVNTGTTRVACEDCCGALTDASVESKFMADILGASPYAKQLAVDFAQALDDRYTLNGRYRRAFWINPGYEWTPTQTGGNSIFSLSQKIFVYALITLDEAIASSAGKSISTTLTYASNGPTQASPPQRRRMLLQALTGDALTEAEASAGSAYVTYQVTQKSMMAQAYDVPADRVATWKVSFQLTEAEACMGNVELQVHLRSTLVDQLTTAVSKHKTLQISSLAVDKAGVKCKRRRQRMLLSGFSPATADATMLIVFDEAEQPFFNTAILESMSGVNSVAAIEVADSVKVSADVTEQAPEASSSDSSSNTALIAGIAGGVGGVVLVGAGAVVWMRARREEEQAAVPVISTIDVGDLKAQLADEA